MQEQLFTEASQNIPLVDVSLEDKTEAAINVLLDLMHQGYVFSVASSFGKDSSILLAIFFMAYDRFQRNTGKLPKAMVVTSNTLIENSIIDEHSHTSISEVESYVKKKGWNISTKLVTPEMNDRYLTNILAGRIILSHPANGNRKCASMMKVNPINKAKKEIFSAFGKDKVITLVGKRTDESKSRESRMANAGETAVDVVRNDLGELVLSPIADFTLDDVFMFIGKAINNRFDIDMPINFERLMDVYREANGGDCEVVIAYSGKASTTGCGHRFGCSICAFGNGSETKLIESDNHDYMIPTQKLRSYLLAQHFNPNKRSWLGRSTCDENGKNGEGDYIKISPNTYSPEYLEELLRIILTIDVMEQERAAAAFEAPKFRFVAEDDLVYIDFKWAVYGHHAGHKALEIWHDIYTDGNRYFIPDDYTTYEPKDLDSKKPKIVPFVDSDFYQEEAGLYDFMARLAECENTTVKFGPINVKAHEYANAKLAGANNIVVNGINHKLSTLEKKGMQVFDNLSSRSSFNVDVESAEFFVWVEGRYYANKYKSDWFPPAVAAHNILRFGTIEVAPRSAAMLDKSIRIGNQIHKLGLRKHLSNPYKIREILEGVIQDDTPVTEQSLSLF